MPEELEELTGLLNEMEDDETGIAWENGRIGFDDVSLNEVAQQFYRRYGVHLKLADTAIANITG